MIRMFRSHGMVRESRSEALRTSFTDKYPDLNPDFIFAFPAYNVRSSEINAVMGRQQLKRLDANNEKRRANLKTFLGNLDPRFFRTDFDLDGSCNYAFTLVLREPDQKLADDVMQALTSAGVEFRRGTSGGGNQLRQPYLRKLFGNDAWKAYPEVDHVHFFGMYIGNYPELDEDRILALCSLLNAVAGKK